MPVEVCVPRFDVLAVLILNLPMSSISKSLMKLAFSVENI